MVEADVGSLVREDRLRVLYTRGCRMKQQESLCMLPGTGHAIEKGRQMRVSGHLSPYLSRR